MFVTEEDLKRVGYKLPVFDFQEALMVAFKQGPLLAFGNLKQCLQTEMNNLCNNLCNKESSDKKVT